MTEYADNVFYITDYLAGKEAVVPDSCFVFYARSATQKIKAYTGSNVDENNIKDEVKMCCCEIAELLYKHEQMSNQTDGITSESVAGWSRSYESADTKRERLIYAVKESVYKWLGGTGLLYRGLN